ncbi:squalene/phytoene synthase family protein [Rhizobiaceae bacterium]|nr:squalene/phytoene synthase family protein [Rhizobiaceae bacterium]
MSEIAEDDLAVCVQTLRDTNRGRWLATLLMPASVRTAATVLFGLSAELDAVVSRTSEPLAGEIRLQWWSDAIAGKRDEEASGSPLARNVMVLRDAHELPVPALQALAEGRVAELYADPFPDRTAFEGWAGETRAATYQLLALCAFPEEALACATASGHAGVLSAIADTVTELHRNIDRGFVRLPVDLLAATGSTREEFLADPEKRSAAITALIDWGREREALFAKALGQLPKPVRALYKPVAIDSLVLRRAAKMGDELARRPMHVRQWRQQLALLFG